MIRRTLLNRALRQRDLARTLIARHPLAAQDQRQPRLADRPAAYIDDSAWHVPATAEAEAAVYSNAAPPEVAPMVYAAAAPETELPLAAWPAALAAATYVAALPIADSADTPESVPTLQAAPTLPAAAPDLRASAPLADLVRRMREPGWAPPEAAPPDTTQLPPVPTPDASLTDLIRRMRAPGWALPETTAPETTQAAPIPTPGNPQADRVPSMRDPGSVLPEQLPSATTQSSPTPEQTANDRIADIVRQMWPAPQRSASQRARPRTPLGQRMAEASNFGQTPASSQHTDPVVAPAQTTQPAEAADRQQAQVFPETEPPAVERPRDDVAPASAPIAPGESADPQSIAASSGGEIAAQLPPAEESHGVPDAALGLSSPLDIVEPHVALPLAAPHALSQLAEADTALAGATAVSPAQAFSARSASQPAESPPPPSQQDMDSTPDVPLSSASTRADSLTPPLPRHLSPSAPDEALRADEPTLAQQTRTPSFQFPTPTPEASEPTLTQSAEAALAAAQVTTPIVPGQPPTTRAASAQASLEIHLPAAAPTDVPHLLPDHIAVPVVAAPPTTHTQTNVEPDQRVASEAQRAPAEANAMPAQAADAPASHSVKTHASPPETARENQPALFRQPEFSAPQLQSSLPTERPAQAAAHLSLPISNASTEPAADMQSLSDVRIPHIEHASAPQEISESAPSVPERRSPQDWAARLSPAEASPPARIAETASSPGDPNAAQRAASEPSSASAAQIDITANVFVDSVRQPIAAPNRALPIDDLSAQPAPAQSHTANQHVPMPEGRVAHSAPIQSEPAPNQQPRSIQSADTVAGSVVPPSEQPVASATVETPLAHSNSMQQRSNALPVTDDARPIVPSRAPEATDAAPLQESPSALPRSDPRSPIVRDGPLAAADIPAAAAPEPGSPQAWAARFARHREMTEPQPEPTAPRVPAMPIGQPSVQTAMSANADAVAPEPGSPQAWAARFARHREMTEPQPEATAARVPAMPIGQPALPASTAPVDVPAVAAPEPGSPQAWAARFARHRELTEPQPEATAALAPAMPTAVQAPSAPIEAQAIPAVPGRLVTAIVDPIPGRPTRFIPARRTASHAAPAAPADIRTAATERAPIVQEAPTDASTAAADVPAVAAPEPGSPQAWAARFARHREMTEPQPEPTGARAPAMPIGQPSVQMAASANADVGVAPEPGSPQAWAARFARHRELTEPQPEPTAARVPAMPIGQPSVQAASANADVGVAPEPGSPQAWAARFARHREMTEPQPTAARAPTTPTSQPAQPAAPVAVPPHTPAPMPAAQQPESRAQLNRALDSGPQAALRQATPTPIAETTRRFLQPLVGIDPATVRIFRGPQAERVTAAYKAEALASGDTLALAAQHGEDTPAALGVLAHELTHIARQRDARFVPPLVQDSGVRRQEPDVRSHQNTAGARNRGPVPLPTAIAQRPNAFASAGVDEETLAHSVETQVQQIARTRAEPAAAAHQPLATGNRATPAVQPATHSADWGNLPAPWEPLPEWLAPSRPAAPPAIAHSAGPAQRASSTAAARETAPVQLAESSRSIEGQPAQSAPTPVPVQTPEPDLDALARQVYAVLKQRLAAERRRAQS